MSGASGWRDAEKNSAFAANNSIHALNRCVSGGESCIVAAKSSGGGVVWCVDGVKDCIGEGDALVGRTSVRHRGPLLRAGSLCVDLTGGAYFSRVRPGSSPPAGDLLLCFAKEVSKKGDPASPVIRCANDSPALLEVGGRRGTRRLRRLRQPRRTTPPTSPLLGGSDGLFGITEPGLGLWSGLNGWRKADPLGAFDRNGRLPRASKFAPTCSPRSTIASRRVTPCGLTRPTATCLVEFPKSPRAPTCNSRLRKGSVIPESPSQTAEQRREVVRASGRPVWPGRLLCLLSWRRKKVGRPPGRVPANPCPAKHHRQTSAGSRRPPDANPCQPKAPPVGRTSVRHPSWGMARCVGLKSDLPFDLQLSGPARQGVTMGNTP